MKSAFGIGRLIVAVTVVAALLTSFAFAQESSSLNLVLKLTSLKTNSEILALPKAPAAIEGFTPTYVYCPTSGCTLEITMTSELSDVSPGVDSLRFLATVDGTPVDMLPTTNLGINSTAKAGQMESGTGTWMRRNLVAGWHYVRVSANVSDTNGDGFVSGYIGDRSLAIRVYGIQ